MESIKIKSTVDTEVTMNGYSIEDILYSAKELAHEVLEELSVYRQKSF